MLRIRFLRRGKKHQPFFRIVVTDQRNAPQGGKFKEVVGFFNPQTKEKQLKKDRIKYWLSNGAQLSDRVHNLLISEKIIKGEKIPVHRKAGEEKPVEEKKEEPKQETKSEEGVDKESEKDKIKDEK